jgi:hypothetical protein
MVILKDFFRNFIFFQKLKMLFQGRGLRGAKKEKNCANGIGLVPLLLYPGEDSQGHAF